MRSIGLGFVIAALCGCSSGGGGTAVSRSDAAATLAASLEGANISDPATLPKSGTATYAGYVTLDLPIGGSATPRVGDLDLVVDFKTSADLLSGNVTNIEGLGGSIALTGGTLDRGTDPDVDYTFDGELAGTLIDGTDRYVVDGAAVGEFRGRRQDGITGQLYGDITGPNGQDLFQGTLAATRTD